MRVVCDNCGMSYKIPDSKLTKEVNKATCRKCGHAIYIRRPDLAPLSAAPTNIADERTLVTNQVDQLAAARAAASWAEPGGDATNPRVGGAGSEAGGDVAAAPYAGAVAPDAPLDDGRSRGRAQTRAPEPNSDWGQPEPVSMPRPTAPRAQQPPAAVPRAPMDPVPPERVPVARPAADRAPAERPQAERAPVAPAERPPAERPIVERAAPAPLYERGAAEQATAPRVGLSKPAARPAEPSPASAPFDPRADLTLVMLASMLAAFGVLVLVVNSLINSPVVLGGGTFLAFLGVSVALFVVITGARGTRAASWAASLVGGFVMAGIGTSFAVAAGIYGPTLNLSGDRVAVNLPGEPAVVAIAPPPAAVVVPPVPAANAVVEVAPPATTAPGSTAATAAPVTAPAAAPAATPAPAVAPAATAAPKTTTTTTRPAETTTTAPKPTTTAASTARTTAPATTSTSASRPTTTAAPAPAPAATAAPLNPTVIDTMIKSNKGVKGCFASQTAKDGAQPSGVKIKMSLQPTGKVSSAAIPSGSFQGTDFDKCVSGSMKAIQFPPFAGDAVTFTYKFPI